MNTTASQSAIYQDIRKAALQCFPDIPEYEAVDRYTSETAEGRVLARLHSEAIADFEPQETTAKAAEISGGDRASRIAKALDDAAVGYARENGVGMEAAYDQVLNTSEGRSLREKYDELVRAD